MNDATLQAVVAEIEPQIVGRPFGRIFPLSRLTFAIDFRLPDGFYLFVAIEPSAPRVYLIDRKLRELEKNSLNPAPFVVLLRKKLANAIVRAVAKDAGERIVRLQIEARDDIEGEKNYTLVAQLTGRSANLFLLDERDFIVDELRDNSGDGQEIATKFAAPARAARKDSANDKNPPSAENQSVFPQKDFPTLSAALNAFYTNAEAEKVFQSKAKSAFSEIKREIAKHEKLVRKLNEDLRNHGDAEKWKRYGDLILANLADAVREGGKVLVVDYFDENVPTIEIEIDENKSLTEAAENFFKRYTKARNAKEEIAKRAAETEAVLTDLRERREHVEQAIAERDEEFFADTTDAKRENRSGKAKNKTADAFTGARRYISSDGMEILVGKGSKDNDFLTFRASKSLDFWLHAADYAGSHVVVRNPHRLENIPPKTLVEAAELAAFFSQGKTQTKAAVNYTQRKFVNKPKGAAPGLVSLSSFKTVLVEPKVGLERELKIKN